MLPRRKRSTGFSLMELVILIVIVSLALPPIAVLLHQTLLGNAETHMQTMAINLAKGLMEEILSKSYEDPQAGAGSFGTEEAGRIDYDDVDDYDGLNDMPPRDSQGNTLSDYAGFRTRVTVENVSDSSPGGSPVGDGSSDFKRVTVTVESGSGAILARLVGLASSFGAAGGGPTSGLTFIERRSDDNDDCEFRVRNDTGSMIYVTHITVTWESPTAWYEEVELRVVNGFDYDDVWHYNGHNYVRMGSGETAMFNLGDVVAVPSGSVMEIELEEFSQYRTGSDGGYRDVSNTTFTVQIWAAPNKYHSFTVPPEP